MDMLRHLISRRIIIIIIIIIKHDDVRAYALGPKSWLRVTQVAQEPLRGSGISDDVRDDVIGASEGWLMLTQVNYVPQFSTTDGFCRLS